MEMENRKILIIRFNAIGDIVLSSPVTKALSQHGYEVHYLVKPVFSEIVQHNPYVRKVWTLRSSLNDTISELRDTGFSHIIDLHNNYRSRRVCKGLAVPFTRLRKKPFRMWLLTQMGIHPREYEKHIVHRMMDVIRPLLGDHVSSPLPEFFFPPSMETITTAIPNEEYMVVVVGAAYRTKQIPVDKLIDVINKTALHAVLIGGSEDEETAWQIEQTVVKSVTNLTGKLSITGSARIIKDAKLVLSGDTGMMHIAAALGKPLVAVYGSTHPVLGYTPFGYSGGGEHYLIQNESLNCRPCTKQGRHRCPRGHFRCMKDLDTRQMIEKINRLI